MGRLAKPLLLTLMSVAALFVASAVMYFPVVLWHGHRAPEMTAVMRYRAAEAEASGRGWDLRHDWVPIERISPNLQAAVLAAEDTRFFEHHGFDLEQIRSAWKAHEEGERVRGASTITQQTVKNLYLTPRRSGLRKLREAILTAWMELWLPKRRILELYLNIVELGPGIFGAEAAAREYFDRPAARLTSAQAALLAATLPAPLARNPARPTAGLWRRQRLILGRMERWYGYAGRIPEDEVAAPTRPARLPSEPLELPVATGAETTSATTAPAADAAPGDTATSEAVPAPVESVPVPP